MINYEFGYATGDQVLIELPNIIKAEIKGYGEALRVGGEEFLILLRIANDKTAVKLAETIRYKTSQLRLKEMQGKEVTVSVGVSIGVAINEHHSSIGDMIKIADKKLNQAKQQGRNLVTE